MTPHGLTDAAVAPLVSVLVTTFNHAAFVADALDSVIAQRTTFAFEVIVGDDGSTDGTRELLRRYAGAAPECLRVVEHPQRGGECANLRRTWLECRGDYVALLDGDDIWTSPDKLQRQADFMVAHPGCALSFHNATAFHHDGKGGSYLFNPPDQNPAPTLADLFDGNFIATCAVMLRRSAVGGFPGWYDGMPFGDWPLYILAAERGSMAYLDEVLAAYRIHGGGAWSGMNERDQTAQVLGFYQQINEKLEFRYDEMIKPLIARHQDDLARLS